MTADATWVIVDGEAASAAEPVLRADDRGFLYGDAVFETLRAVDGRPVALSRHLARLAASLEALRIGPLDVAALLAPQVQRALALNGLTQGEAAVRVTVTRGRGAGPLPPAGARPTTVVAARPLGASVLARRRGVHGVPVEAPRRALAALKTSCYLPSVMALLTTGGRGPEPVEPLFIDGGQVLEGATTNLFVLGADGVLQTPPADGRVLPGIARAQVIERVAGLGLPFAERPLPVDALRRAPAAFVTSALLPIAPLLSFDGHPFPAGGPGADLLEALHGAW